MEELLVEASSKIAHLRRYCLGGTWSCVFFFLDPLGINKGKKMEDSVWRRHISGWRAGVHSPVLTCPQGRGGMLWELGKCFLSGRRE